MGILLSWLVGTCFGSLAGLVITRLPKEESLIWGRSHCDSCKKALRPWDLIPIISQLCHRSKCYYCQQPIPIRYLFLEISAGLLGICAYLGWLDMTSWLLTVMSLILATFDWLYHQFPLVIGLIFIVLFSLVTPLKTEAIIWLLLAGFKNKYMGKGDFLWLFLASLTVTFYQMLWILQGASLLGILFHLRQLRSNEKNLEIPFIPFLSTAYLLVLLLERWPFVQSR